MHVEDLFFGLLPILMSVGWIIELRVKAKSAREKLGEVIATYDLATRWGRIAQRAVIALTVAMTATIVVVMFIYGPPPAEDAGILLQMSSLISIAFAVREASRVTVGSNGFALGAIGFIPWSDVRKIAWDRDIGQRQWGATIEFTRPKSKAIHRHRLYISRDRKAELEPVLDLRPALQAEEPGMLPTHV